MTATTTTTTTTTAVHSSNSRTMNSADGNHQNAMKVRVGVRVRPLSSKERSGGGEDVLTVTGNSVELSGRKFTYDSMFDADSTTQADLYQTVSPSLLRAFLDGYNATIMAYGQTGSGKTFTMGSEAHSDMQVTDSTGLIPRFMNDIFQHVDTANCTLETTFLEVYGEDVHDLLQPTRTPLPLREDSGGGIVVAGLTAKPVQTAAKALAVLHEGTLNRTTAATLMNLTSSRSHAVFTVTLTQSASNEGGVASMSRFTFVDLAGSERMKKTGAQGERAREGIEINKGLLALGNVINALADEERSQKKTHVPYRQSKLTRLLQDALGGNSQTVFLACVSPAETNASETLSTLHYANRARNIQNAVSRNVDLGSPELQQWQSYCSLLQAELISLKFGNSNCERSIGKANDDLMQRKDVNEYLDKLHALSSTTVTKSHKAMLSTSQYMKVADAPVDVNQSVSEGVDPATLHEMNPDEDMAILDQLLDLQQQDQDYGQEQKIDDERLKLVEGELAEQELLLLQLRESLKAYHNMKAKYENLMAEVQQLELEKAQLAKRLDKASADPTVGCSRTIKKEIDKVEHNLIRARSETWRHREMYKKAEQEAKKCRSMELKIADLKHGRASLMKKQKEAAAKYRDLTESKTREILALKRKDRSKEREMTKLQTNIQIYKRNLDKRQMYCKKLLDQKKNAETHLLKLLSMRQRELRERSSTRYGEAKKNQRSDMQSVSSEEVESICFLLDTAVGKSVSLADLKSQYESRAAEYSESMRAMVAAVKNLETQEDAEECRQLEDTIQSLELKLEISGSSLEKLQSRITRIETQDPDVVTKLVASKSPPILRSIIVRLVDQLVDSAFDCRKLGKAIELKTSVVQSFESEVESLRRDVNGLKSDLTQRQLVVNGVIDPVATINQLEKQCGDLRIQLEESEQESLLMGLFAKNLTQEYHAVQLELSETKQVLTLARVIECESSEVHPARNALTKLQEIWKDVGLSTSFQEDARLLIQNCLPDTCKRLLNEAEATKANTQSQILLHQQQLIHMCESMHIEPLKTSRSLGDSHLKHLSDLKRRHERLHPVFSDAVARRDGIKSEATELCSSMEIENDILDSNIRQLMQQPPIDVRNCIPTTCDLSDDFLSGCEASITQLRIAKSKMLTGNAVLERRTISLVNELGEDKTEILALVTQSVRRQRSKLPSWWSDNVADTVANGISSSGGVLQASELYSRHLSLFFQSLSNFAVARRLLSQKLRLIVERAQETLLKAVNGEIETNEAYSSFHSSLFQLPSLSKERIHSCMREIEVLKAGVEVISQSEIEALTVVWEALGVSMTNRAKFWGEIDSAVREIDCQPVGPFEDVIMQSRVEGEDWVLVAVKSCTKNYRDLETQLFRLEHIHDEVEQLRARQDAKSSIISLDTEVRLLSSKLNEFEDQKCHKQRLVTKKNPSFTLVKEERFRKHMQTKFTAKLDQLVDLLKKWKQAEGSTFDQNLLSDDVRSLLKNQDRNEFMHLRTTEYKPTPTKPLQKRPASHLESGRRSSKRQGLSSRNTKNRMADVAGDSSRNLKRQTPSSRTSPNKRVKKNKLIPPQFDGSEYGVATTVQRVPSEVEVFKAQLSSTYPKPLTLDPFGTVLQQAFSPTRRHKEN